jgi:cell division protein FtsL
MKLGSGINSLKIRADKFKNQVFEYCRDNRETIIKIAKIVGISMVAIGTLAIMASIGVGGTALLFSKGCPPGGDPVILFLMMMSGLICVVFNTARVLEFLSVLFCSASCIIFSNPIFYIIIAAILVTSIVVVILGIVILKVSSKYEDGNRVIDDSENEMEIIEGE